MIYKPVKGSSISIEQAQKFGERIETLMEANDGSIIATQVVDDAKDKDSPLHEFFEWNNKRAADRYRLEQARYILRSIEVVIKTDGGQETSTRAFHYVTIDNSFISERNKAGQVVVAVKRAMSEDDLRKQIIEGALRQLKTWQRKYKQYQELAAIIKVIDEMVEEIES